MIFMMKYPEPGDQPWLAYVTQNKDGTPDFGDIRRVPPDKSEIEKSDRLTSP